MKVFDLSNPRNLWKRYTVGLALLAMLLLGTHGLHVKIINSGINDSEIVDLSGRQRMLSQRVMGLAFTLQEDPSQPMAAAALEEAANQFEKAHEQLLIHAMENPSVAKIYSIGSVQGLDHRSREFVSNVRNFMASAGDKEKRDRALRHIQSAAFTVLLSDLDSAVKAFSYEAKKSNEELQTYQAITLFSALLLLVAELLFIFLPAHRTVVTSLETADEKASQLFQRNNELQAITDRLSFAANHDHLTGLANRKKLSTELTRMLRDKRTNNDQICVMHIDLDRFKEVNDTLGHPVGDNVIRRVAETMRSRVRTTDLVARVGGDEFVIILSIEDQHLVERAHNIAEGIIERIKQPMHIDGHTCSIGASIGYIFASAQNDDPDELMANADIALYAAKNGGKGRAILFEEKMRQEIEFRHALLQDLENAIERNEFVPFFQPKVCFADGSLAGFEVLVRWEHPQRGLLPPSEFLELAEESLIVEQIDKQAITRGLDALSTLRDEGWEIPSISLNASGQSLRTTGFVDQLLSSAEIRGIDTSDITIEVLESILISDTDDKAFSTLQSLSDRGFKIDIDDFGTGYASLSVLADLQLSGLKIDRSLTQKIQEPRTRMVIDAIVGLSQRMELEVTVEGIETASQYTETKMMECDFAQGYGIGVPMSLEEFRQWLDTRGRNENLKLVI